MRFTNRLIYVALVTGFVLSLSSCSSSRKSAADDASSGSHLSSGQLPPGFYTPPHAVYEVTYTANTVRIDFPTTQRLLRSVSEDARVFVFDGNDPRLADLQPGKIMFLEHLGARRVSAVQRQGSQTDVLTEFAGLTDFIQNGRIEFSTPINSERAHGELSSPP